MIAGALEHLPGIGPRRAERLRALGCDAWEHILTAPDPIGLGKNAWAKVRTAAGDGLEALDAEDVPALARRLHPRDHWRVLAQWFDRTAYLDIETDGLDVDSRITLVSTLKDGRFERFVRGENLDELLDWLEEVTLLVTFNGASFDIPWLLRHFHVPSLPCAHIDLRWVAYHAGERGGLKQIEAALGLRRPSDLAGLSGADAITLWRRWELYKDIAARRTLERYGCADVAALQWLSARLLAKVGCSASSPAPDELWARIQADLPPVACVQGADNNHVPAYIPNAMPTTDRRSRLQRRWREMHGRMARG